MGTLGPLLLLFILWPFLELSLLIRIGRATGFWVALLLVVVPAVLGAALARREGLKAWFRIQDELRAGRLPGNQLVDAMLILVAGALLIAPGLISDTLGLLLLVPPLRAIAREHLKRRFGRGFHILHFGAPPPAEGHGDFVDVEAREAGGHPPTQADSTRHLPGGQ
jgi:UPF0716 protein FxsA